MQVAVLLILMLPRFSLAFGGIECSSYKLLEEADRSIAFSSPSVKKCDKYLQFGWYRFRGAAGTMMPTSCVPTSKCGTDAPGWLQGRHPSTSEGVIQAKVCFHWNSNCCHWSSLIRVRNCGAFYVYQLVQSPQCSLRYCGNGVQSPGPVNPPGPNPAPGPVNAPGIYIGICI
ncbi:pancreatic secretory granule membrane major glycoprotein GP2-like [Oculina patagonica]